jgi:hypothetical protein
MMPPVCWISFPSSTSVERRFSSVPDLRGIGHAPHRDGTLASKVSQSLVRRGEEATVDEVGGDRSACSSLARLRYIHHITVSTAREHGS